MKKLKFTKAEFLQSALDKKSFPTFKQDSGELFPEIMIAGKSNVGKSSLINHLLNIKELARTSTKPGKTITINFFKIDNKIILLDFPGYGYAKQSQELKKSWAENFDIFLDERENIELLLLLVDSRRKITTNDLIFYNWAVRKNIPCSIILTKSDKLKKRELDNNYKMVLEDLEKISIVPPKFCIRYSIKSLEGKKILISKINSLLGEI